MALEHPVVAERELARSLRCGTTYGVVVAVPIIGGLAQYQPESRTAPDGT